MESKEINYDRHGRYGSEHVGPRPRDACTGNKTATIGFHPMPGDIHTSEIGFRQPSPMSHCDCGRGQQLRPPLNHGPEFTDSYRPHEPSGGYRNNSPHAYAHSRPSSGEMHSGGYESGRFDKNVYQHPYPEMSPNKGNQNPGQINPIGVNSAPQGNIGSVRASYGESGNATPPSAFQNQEEYAPDGVRLLKYSGS
uniref:Dscam_C domain-containing protein n=1 Tax=Ascaris lumbricoides TaxID=6252 RepID=A0A0M3IP35_ASCLU